MDQRQYTQTEERIFEAALTTFADKGHHGARMQEIADKAGINKSLLHYYFRTKDRMYEAVFEHVFHRFLRSFSEALQPGIPFVDTLRIFVDRYISIQGKNPAITRLFMIENMAGGSVLRKKLLEMLQKEPIAPPQIFITRMQEAIDNGEIRAVDPLQTLISLMGACVFPFVAKPAISVFSPNALDDQNAFMETRKKHLFDLFYNGLKIDH